MTRPSTEEEGSSPLSTPNRPPAIAGGAVATAGQQYIVRSLELTTQAFQDLLTLTSKQTISRLARSTCCQRPNPQSAWAVRFSRTRHPFEWRVLETCASPTVESDA